MRKILIIVYILLFAIILLVQEKGWHLLSPRSYVLLGVVFLMFWGAGLFMSYLKKNDNPKEYDFVKRFFLAASFSGLLIGIVQIFREEYGSALGIVTVCAALLLGMFTKFAPAPKAKERKSGK